MLVVWAASWLLSGVNFTELDPRNGKPIAIYVLVIPLGAVIFHAAGRHPLAGIAAAFAGVSGGFSATFFLPSSLDPLLAGLTQAAANITDAAVVVNPLNNRDIVAGMSKSMSGMGYYLVMAFFCAQFVYAFGQSNLGALTAIKGAGWLKAMGFPMAVILIGVVLLSASVNLMIGSASAKWALIGPIMVPIHRRVLPALREVHRLGTKTINAAGITIWSAATMLTGASWNFVSLIGTRLAMGIGEPTTFPTGGRVVREWIPAGERDAKTSALQSRARATRVLDLLRTRTMWGLALAEGCAVYTRYLFLTWLPSYLQTTRGLTIVRTGLFTAVPYAGAAVLGIALGRISDRLLTPDAVGKGRSLVNDLLRNPEDSGKAMSILIVAGPAN